MKCLLSQKTVHLLWYSTLFSFVTDNYYFRQIQQLWKGTKKVRATINEGKRKKNETPGETAVFLQGCCDFSSLLKIATKGYQSPVNILNSSL